MSIPQSDPSTVKKCIACGVSKPFAEYYRKGPTRYHSRCKACFCAFSNRNAKAKYAANAEQLKAASRRYYHANAAAINGKRQEFRAQNPEIVHAQDRARHAEHREEDNAYKRQWRAEHPEKDREYKSANKAAIDASNAEYRAAHKEELTERSRKWREEHPERASAINAKYSRTHRDIENAAYQRYRGKKLANGGDLTAEEWAAIKKASGYRCLCCGRQEPEIKLTIDHVIPVTAGGPTSAGNVQPLCPSCNARKGDRALDYRDRPHEALPAIPEGIDAQTRAWLLATRDPGFVDALKAGLAAKGMTQAAFAASCGCTPGNISAIFRRTVFGGVPQSVWERAVALDLIAPT